MQTQVTKQLRTISPRNQQEFWGHILIIFYRHTFSKRDMFTVITEWSMWTHFEGVRTKLLLTTFYNFLIHHFKKRKKSCFWNLKKRKICILEHWLWSTNVDYHQCCWWHHVLLRLRSSPVSEWLRTAVPVGLLRSGRRCRHSAAPAFRQPSTACSTSLQAQHLRPSGLFSCRSQSLELSPRFHPGPDHQCRLFQMFA